VIIKGKESKDFYIGQPVAYIPSHIADGQTMVQVENLIFKKHPDVEFGVVKSKNDKFVFVVFFPAAVMYGIKDSSAPSCYPRDLFFSPIRPENFKDRKPVRFEKEAKY